MRADVTPSSKLVDSRFYPEPTALNRCTYCSMWATPVVLLDCIADSFCDYAKRDDFSSDIETYFVVSLELMKCAVL